jgi:hypothetical protein
MNTPIPEDKIWPVEEMVHEDEFTDRVELLRELDQWVVAIQRMGATSTALIAPRRLGKTVLLDRLVNTVFFKPEYRVAPFYFKMTREKRTLRKFLLENTRPLFFANIWPIASRMRFCSVIAWFRLKSCPLIRQNTGPGRWR